MADDVVYYNGKIISFQDEQFDSAIAVEVLEYVKDLELSLKEINRV